MDVPNLFGVTFFEDGFGASTQNDRECMRTTNGRPYILRITRSVAHFITESMNAFPT